MAMKSALHVCFNYVKMMFKNPTTYMFICLAFMYFHQINDACVKFQEETGIYVNAFGYTVGVFSNHTSTFVFGLGCIAVFSGLPLIRENVLFECTRCTRNAWLVGRILYIAFISLAYSFSMMLLCLLTCNGSISASVSWGKILNSVANGITFGEADLPIEICLACTENYTPYTAYLITLVMNTGASIFIGITMLCLTLAFNKITALIATSLIAFLDFVIYEKLPYWVYRFSPLSYTRMSIVSNPYMPHYPTLKEATFSLIIMTVAVSIIAFIVAHRNSLFARSVLNEQY